MKLTQLQDDLRKKTKDELLKEALEFLDDAQFKFCCFVDSFKRSLNGNNK